MIKRPSTQLKSRGNNRKDRRKGAGLTTGNESPSALHKKNDIIELLGMQTEATIRNDGLNDELANPQRMIKTQFKSNQSTHLMDDQGAPSNQSILVMSGATSSKKVG